MSEFTNDDLIKVLVNHLPLPAYITGGNHVTSVGAFDSDAPVDEANPVALNAYSDEGYTTTIGTGLDLRRLRQFAGKPAKVLTEDGYFPITGTSLRTGPLGDYLLIEIE